MLFPAFKQTVPMRASRRYGLPVSGLITRKYLWALREDSPCEVPFSRTLCHTHSAAGVTTAFI